MPDEVSIQGKDQMKLPPEGHMPYTCSVLTKELIDYAAKNINETEEARRRGIKELSEYMKNELKIDYDLGDSCLLCFLRSRKFDVKRSCHLIRAGVEFIDAHKYLFDKDSLDVVCRVVDSKVVGFLPYRDSKGRAILLIRAERWKPDEINADDLIYGAIVSIHTAGENPVNQVAGFVVICDFKNLSLQHVISMSRWIIFGIQALQKCCPCLVKEFHVVHTPAIFRTAWKLVRNMISEKIRKRITFYKSAHWESLHSRIPPAILPEELGGHLGPYSPEHWASDIKMIEKKYNERIKSFINRNKTT